MNEEKVIFAQSNQVQRGTVSIYAVADYDHSGKLKLSQEYKRFETDGTSAADLMAIGIIRTLLDDDWYVAVLFHTEDDLTFNVEE